jgi:hypothetical protein
MGVPSDRVTRGKLSWAGRRAGGRTHEKPRPVSRAGHQLSRGAKVSRTLCVRVDAEVQHLATWEPDGLVAMGGSHDL